ncbi:YraN family protein [Candidatus Saccharibacteria bacterium]|nr:YraN family protein [Candidatus Saccharibacteria bacterium]
MKNTTAVGLRAEQQACQYLENLGYEILQRNFKNRFCEIDIISRNTEYICSVEVKFRSNNSYGGGLGAVSEDKKRRISRAFEYWLHQNPEYLKLQPRLDIISISGNQQITFIENAIEQH